MAKHELVARGATPLVEQPQRQALKAAIGDLTIAFPAGAPKSEYEVRRLLELFAKAGAGFDQRLVAEVLDWLFFNNPRNPFSPTPQDLFEACKARMSEWRLQTWQRFGLGFATWRPSADFTVPADVELRFLRERLQQCSVRSWDDGYSNLTAMPDEAFNRLPPAAFPEGMREELLARRKA